MVENLKQITSFTQRSGTVGLNGYFKGAFLACEHSGLKNTGFIIIPMALGQ